MRISELNKSINFFINQVTQEIKHLPKSVAEIFNLYSSRTQSKEPDLSPREASLIKISSTARRNILLFTVALGTTFKIRVAEAAPPTVKLNQFTSTEEIPFSAQWSQTDLFNIGPTNVAPFTVSIQQINGSPLPTGLVNYKIPLSYEGSTSIQTIGNGYPLFIDLIDQTILSGHNVGLLNGIDVSNVKNPQATSLIPIQYSYDLQCVEENQVCYVLNGNLYTVDFSSGSPVATLVPLINGYRLSVDAKTNLGVITDGTKGLLQLIDFSNPYRPTLLRSISIQGVESVQSPVVAYSNNVSCIVSTIGVGASSFFLEATDFTNITHPISGNVSVPIPAFSSSVYVPFQIDKMGDFCLLTSSYGGVRIFNVKNTTNIREVGSFDPGLLQPISSAAADGNYFYTLGANQINQLDVSNKATPYLLSSTILPLTPLSGFKAAKVVGDNLFFIDSNGLRIMTKGDATVLAGTPAGGTKGNYTFLISAVDANGNTVGAPQQFSFEIKPAVTLQNSIPTQQFVIGKINTLVLDNIFQQIVGNPVSLSLTPLPDYCSFNPLSATLTCAPTLQDRGVKTLMLKGTDALNAFEETSFQINVVNGPEVVNRIANQIVEIGIPLLINTTNTFIDLDGQELSYSLAGPSWLKYSNLTLYGTPSVADIGIETASLTAQAPNGLSAPNSFQMTVQYVSPPSINAQFAATIQNSFVSVHQPFTLNIPKALFFDQQGRTAIETDYQFFGSVPSFLSLDTTSDPDFILIRGTPGWGDVGFFTNNVDQFSLTACRKNSKTACTTNLSSISIGGDTIFLLLLKIATGLLGSFGLYKFRCAPWNACMKSRYRKGEIIKKVGEPLTINLSDWGIEKPRNVWTKIFNRMMDREVNQVVSFIPHEQIGKGCKARTEFLFNSILSPMYISSGDNVFREANIWFSQFGNAITSNEIKDPGHSRKITIQALSRGGKILGEVILKITPKIKSLIAPVSELPEAASLLERVSIDIEMSRLREDQVG